MPLTMLAWSVWLFGVLGHPSAAPGPISPDPAVALAGPLRQLEAPPTPVAPEDRLPLWCEVEDEDEREHDDTESAAPLAFLIPWVPVSTWSGLADRVTHPTIRPCSALRSPILRC